MDFGIYHEAHEGHEVYTNFFLRALRVLLGCNDFYIAIRLSALRANYDLYG